MDQEALTINPMGEAGLSLDMTDMASSSATPMKLDIGESTLDDQNSYSAAVKPFGLEQYFDKYEFCTKYLMCCSDCETISMDELLKMGNDDSMKLWNNLGLSYTVARGLPELRDEIGSRLYPQVERSLEITRENIVCFAGAEEAIYCSVKTLLDPNDHMIVVTPCYQSHVSVAETIVGARNITAVPLEETSNWSLNMTAIQRAIRPFQTKLLLVNFPHNPTGTSLSLQRFKELVELARYHDLYIICDEVYRGLEPGAGVAGAGSPRLPGIATLYEKGISIGGLSKSYGMAGLRIGWVAMASVKESQSNHDLFNSIADLKHYLSICNSGPSEILGVIALQNTEAIFSRNAKLVSDNLLVLEAFMNKYSKLFSWCGRKNISGVCCFIQLLFGDNMLSRTKSMNHYVNSNKGTISNATVTNGGDVSPLKNTLNMSVDDLAALLVTKYNILILPGSTYYNGNEDLETPDPNHAPVVPLDTSSYFRVGFGRRDFVEVLGRFESALKEIFE
jgi:aspartate/methionine/tyrosine aminotransferase